MEEVLQALVEAANDRDPAVQEQVRRSMATLGKRKPEKVLALCHAYLVKHPKLLTEHRVALLEVVELVLKAKLDEISYPIVKSVVSLASDEMTRSKDMVSEWQQAASNILVVVGNKHIEDVTEEMLSKFQPGVLPHFFVVQTLSRLSLSNVCGMVPFLKPVLITMLPMLGMVKQDKMKWVFSSALSHFSSCILEYLANVEKISDCTVNKSMISSEISTAYNILFCNWLQSRDLKVRLTVAEALGSMSALMAPEKLEEQFPRLVSAILALYKKSPEPHIISKSLCQILDASSNVSTRVLESQVASLLPALHQQVSAPLDYNNPSTLKNHNEVLRCFSILASAFPHRLIAFLLQRLESSGERNRVGSLAVLRHLVNTSSSVVESKKRLIVSSLRQPLLDQSNKVKKSVVQVISAMAHRGYLELEGGEILVRFMVLHCALPDTFHQHGRHPADPEEVTNEALRSMCENTLHLLTTTVGRVADVLWPVLLCYLTPAQYANATVPICQSLVLLGTRKKAAGEPGLIIDFSKQDGLPSPYVILIRLLVNASYPFRARGRGAPSLRLLEVLGPSIHLNVENLWEVEVPLLLSYLEESTVDTLNRRRWERGLLELLSKTLVAIMDDKWCCQLASEMSRYLVSYNNSLDEKAFLYKCLGVTLQRCYNKEVVKQLLQEMLITAHHNDAIERVGVAKGIGLCASTHLDDTLAKLEDFGKSDVFRKASGIFGLLKDKSDVDMEKVKSTLILSYGYVALHAPEDKILGRIDSEILHSMSRHFNTKVLGIKVETKDLAMKISLIQSVGLIARAISTCVRRQAYLFAHKQELLGIILAFVKAEPTEVLRTPVRHLAMTTCASLMTLEPTLTESETSDMLQTCMNSVLGLPSEESLDEGKEEDPLDLHQREALYTDTFNAFHELLRKVLAQDLTPDGLQSMFKHIEVWLVSERDHERERAVQTSAQVLDFFLNAINVKKVVVFHTIGALLGRLTPRCVDPSVAVRAVAMDCLYALLHIQLRYEGFAPDYRDEVVESLKTLREKLKELDSTVLYHACSELTKIMSKRLSQQQVGSLILALVEGLTDSMPSCSHAVSVILNTLLNNRGAGLQELVPKVLGTLHLRLQDILEEKVRVAVVRSILPLASQHLPTVMNTLLSFPLPFDSSSCEIWVVLGADGFLASQIMEAFMEKLTTTVPYMEKRDSTLPGRVTRVATGPPLAVTCAFKELMRSIEIQDLVGALFPQLFSTLLLRLGSSVGVQLPKDFNSNATSLERRTPGRMPTTFDVCGVAVEAMHVLLGRAQLDQVLQALDADGAWIRMRDPQQYIEGVALLASAMATYAGPHLQPVMEHLYPSLSSIYECQRTTGMAFLCELMNHHVVMELLIVDTLVNIMMERIADPCNIVRMLAVRGLGNISTGSPEKVNKYARELLAAMSAGMEERDDPGGQIALEAMAGLSKVLRYLDKKNVHMLLVYILMKIKPFLENQRDAVRCASIVLLGNLSRFGLGEPVFRDQIHNVLISLLLHLADPSPQVVKACKFTMRECVPLLGSKLIATMFQNHLHEDRGLHYGEFINDLTKYIIQDFPGMLNFYHTTIIQFFKSSWAEVRASAAMFIGFLLGGLPKQYYPDMNIGSIINGLLQLLRDPDPRVRAKAAEAMGYFHQFCPAVQSSMWKDLDVLS
ncbi:maestro heat-like repeat-containing protein family member 1 [Scleropages formosus]|uniref:maestro heat-like repeat-containing protein family member 1 n=1 Tax=Scleropages formosus TaxID=113540 RepID=UPI0010FA8BC2|nr:maestro heat-like repeat-containing protein family member 1 [Scleropages formosus]